MISNELTVMQNGNLKQPCISIVVPLEAASEQSKRIAMLSVEKAIRKAENFLQSMYPAQTKELVASLLDLTATYAEGYDITAEGLGLYVAPGYSRLFQFHFPVQEKVHIAEKFSIRELLYLKHYAIDYILLHINEKMVQCFKGCLNKLEEIQDNNFPRIFHNDYEYSKPARLSSHSGYAGVKGFEKDKSVIISNHVKTFYKEADRQLSSYLGGLPLIIAGPRKDIARMQEITHHKKNIITTINGNYSKNTIKVLQDRVWPYVKSWIDEKDHNTVADLMQQKRAQHAEEGLKSVWTAAQNGRGDKLVVEKDFSCQAFTDVKTGKLLLKAPKTAHHIVIDAVEEIMRMIVKKGGEVVFVKNGDMEEFEHIVLLTRY